MPTFFLQNLTLKMSAGMDIGNQPMPTFPTKCSTPKFSLWEVLNLTTQKTQGQIYSFNKYIVI
jgi:hypothetical protein